MKKKISQKKLERNVRRELERKQRKLRRKLLREEVYSTKISMVPLWRRFIVCLFSFALIGFSAWCYFESGPVILSVVFLLAGIVMLIYGIYGNRETVDSALGGIDAGVSSNLLDVVIEGFIDGI
jgi:hypothetical protein